MTKNYTEYTDYMWAQDLIDGRTVGPVPAMEFKPCRERIQRALRNLGPLTPLPITLRAGYDDEAKFTQTVVRVVFENKGITYYFNSKAIKIFRKSIKNIEPIRFWRFFCSHLQFSSFYVKFDHFCDEFLMDIGDTPLSSHPMLTYCTNKKENFLLVDPFFIVSDGYRGVRTAAEQDPRNWADKIETVFWRGSASGVMGRFSKSQRYLLCRAAHYSRHKEKLDVGIINTQETHLNQLRQELNRDIPSYARPFERVDPKTFLEYRYNFDVDGNSNSWGGMFNKMLSNSYLLKVRSLRSNRQWYYDELENMGLYSNVAADLSDLDELLDSIFSLPISERAEFARGLFDFALGMTVRSEFEKNNAKLHDWLDRSS